MIDHLPLHEIMFQKPTHHLPIVYLTLIFWFPSLVLSIHAHTITNTQASAQYFQNMQVCTDLHFGHFWGRILCLEKVCVSMFL